MVRPAKKRIKKKITSGYSVSHPSKFSPAFGPVGPNVTTRYRTKASALKKARTEKKFLTDTYGSIISKSEINEYVGKPKKFGPTKSKGRK
jgi:hypothetical protein